MLRRMSVHAAGLTERSDHFVWENLSSASFDGGAIATFERAKITQRLREYAIAGVLHLDHLAALPLSQANVSSLKVAAFQLGGALGISVAESRVKLDRLLQQHAQEWHSFVRSLGRESCIAQWAGSVPL